MQVTINPARPEMVNVHVISSTKYIAIISCARQRVGPMLTVSNKKKELDEAATLALHWLLIRSSDKANIAKNFFERRYPS